ncbi:class E sortase [Kribbella sp. NPDC059898]|uniref:class E sortase n=1 Tax=Kribbella sp. NPDC059898 TaxID=3346995 RepID=UPI00366023D8
MKAWKPVWRWLTASVAFAGLIAVAIVVLGRKSDQKPPGGASAAGQPATKAPKAAPSSAGDEALVNRMLDQIRADKPVEPQFPAGDNPASGVPIAAIKAKPGEQLGLGRLVIPRLALNDELNNGVDDAALEHGVGHWPGTPLPGSPGNSVISGHRSTHDKPFLYLEKLRPGDPIKVTVGARTTTYKVFKTTIVPQAQYVKFVLRQPTDPGVKEITLFACNPITAHIQRIVVQARAA